MPKGKHSGVPWPGNS